MTNWSPAPNLKRRVDMVHVVYPKMEIGEVGDFAHSQEASDHNPDARGIVHAIDIMTETDAANDGAAAIILAWLLGDVTDLQYVIHDRRIYGRDEANGWKGSPYTGSDPHTNHIHVSGKHGSTGKNAATGTGYDTTAEAYTPGITLQEFMEALMPLTAADVALIWAYPIPNGLGHSAALALGNADVRTDSTTNKQLPALATAVAAVQSQANSNGSGISDLKAALAKLAPGQAGTVGSLSDADVAKVAKAVLDGFAARQQS